MPRAVNIIAEVASNHGGDLKIAKEMIKVAAQIGVDYVKFQSWQTATLRDKQKDEQYEWFKKTELSDRAHYELLEECRKRGIKFLTTCFNIERVEFLAKLGIKEIKVGSPDTASYRMLAELKTHFEHIIISTGMASEEEIRTTAKLLDDVNFTLMHCVSLYPTPLEKVNLRRMNWLTRFTTSVGFSDHCIGVEAAELAIARGAKFVEKHFSLGEKKGCRFSPWDATPDDMTKIVRFAEDCYLMMGEGKVEPDEEELKAREKYNGRWGNNR